MKNFFWLPFLLMAAVANASDLPNLLVRDSQVRIAGFSSATGAADLNVLLPPAEALAQDGVRLNDFVWCTADNAPFPHWATFEFPERQWLTTLVFNNELNDELAYPGIAARDVEVWGGEESKDKLRRIASFRLERNRNDQAVRIDPVRVRWLHFVITSNWGNPTWTEISAFAAYDDGTRPSGFGETLKRQGKVDVYGIYFDFGSAMLRPESRKALDEIVAYLLANPEQKLVVEGHTDNVGTDRANTDLSQQRASAVVDALVKRGVLSARLQPIGLGSTQPLANNTTASGRARNRRVTIRSKR